MSCPANGCARTHESSRKRRQVTSKRKVELFESFKGQKLSAEGVSDRIFEGVTFCERPSTMRS